jgi:polysaccharide export outer membrane protein
VIRPIAAQDITTSKRQTEDHLTQMTPEEVEKKLKELGITREEALRLARAQGLSLEDIIRGTEEPSPSDLDDRPLRFLVPAKERVGKKIEADSLKEMVSREKLIVPGFTDRPSLIDTLLPFGYDVFRNRGASFETAQNIATPASYALGPGDEVTISVWGETQLNYRLVVNRDGEVVVPDVGPVVAAGLTVPQLRDRLVRRMSAIYSGLQGGASSANTFLDVSLGKLRTLQVFVLGEVNRPGGYPMSSLSTVFQALYEAGGPTVDGTLREIRIVRSHSSMDVDLYDYLVEGKVDRDVRLLDGDLVFVKPAGKRVAIQGKVVRQAIYEVRSGEGLGDVIRMAGGLRFDAYHERIHIERIVPFDERQRFGNDVTDIDVSVGSVQELRGSPFLLEDGDLITIEGIGRNPVNRVQITGNVRKPGVFELSPGMRIRDLILRADSLDRNTFLETGTLFRLLKNLRREVYSFSVRRALERQEQDNLALENEDSVVIYRESRFFPEQVVTINGAVRKPGSYRRDDRMSVGELIVLAGGLREDGMTSGVEVSRMETTSVDVYSQIYKIDLSARYWEPRENEPFLLKDYDHVFVPSNPRYSRQKLVSVTGYVMYPGSYSIRNADERLAQIIARAGGLRPGAYLEASRLIRKLNNVGVIPIDFSKAIGDPTSRDNIVMNEGDSIHVAFTEDVVYVRGEVIVPTSVLYKRDASLSYYIDQAGGYKEEADDGRTVVILPSGKKWDGDEILPGSSIYVPKEIERPSNTLAIIRDTATILASLAAITIGIVQVTK